MATRRLTAVEGRVDVALRRYARALRTLANLPPATFARSLAGPTARLRDELATVIDEARRGVDGRYAAMGGRSWYAALLAHLGEGTAAAVAAREAGEDPVEAAVRAIRWRVHTLAVAEQRNAQVERALARYDQSADVGAVRWRTTSDNPCKVCVWLATTDAYGLGPGVYPKAKVPQPPHPRCRCRRLPVAVSELDGLTPAQANRLPRRELAFRWPKGTTAAAARGYEAAVRRALARRPRVARRGRGS